MLDSTGSSIGTSSRVPWAQEPVLELGVEHGDADAFAGELVGVGAREALDQAVQAQAAEVVAHLGLALGLAEVLADESAEALVGEAGEALEDVAEGAGQSHCS